jgi:hypothetical protein
VLRAALGMNLALAQDDLLVRSSSRLRGSIGAH